MMETNDDTTTVVEVVDGAQYEKGLLNTHFVNNKEKNSCELDNPYILLIENSIENVRQIQSVLEFIIRTNKSLLIIMAVIYFVVSLVRTRFHVPCIIVVI